MRARRKPTAAPRTPHLVALQGGRDATPTDAGPIPVAPAGRPPGDGPPAPRLKLKWLRVLFVFGGMGALGAVSFVFGMLMAVASDLPEIEALDVPQRPSQILDRDGNVLGLLTSNENRILVRSDQINPSMKHAVVAIEDRRFYTNSGVDFRGIGRAVVSNVMAGDAVQGASTIPQQLVKNRLNAQADRTVFAKIRESAMAFHVTRKWDKERILRNYLNTIYYGYGAYGIESAARTYFARSFGIGTDDPVCGSGARQQRCADLLNPAQSALIAGVIANPTAFDPVLQPEDSKRRRDMVLIRMREQGYLNEPQYRDALATPLPTSDDIRPPAESSRFPYFTTWVRQQVVDRVGAGKAFEGGLRVRTTIESDVQEAAEDAIVQYLGQTPGANGAPAAALVALDNETSDVVAMVGGTPDDADGFTARPFNLATQGQRQPGSSFKPFILAQALEDGVDPARTFTSAKREFCVTEARDGDCSEAFVVNNYDDNYAGTTTLANATTFSDNGVYAELGLELGTKKVARMARRLGVRSPVSTNLAMTLGGLQQGISPMDMAHAYTTFASGGKLVYGTMAPGADEFDKRGQRGTAPGANGILSIQEPRGGEFRVARQLDGRRADNKVKEHRVISAGTAGAVQDMLESVVTTGTGKRAAVSGLTVAGKTGTTENYGDAWFVGWSPKYTVAVWVGYPDGVTPMQPPQFSYEGEAVAGGTYPAAIWSAFMSAVVAQDPEEAGVEEQTDLDAPEVVGTPVPETTVPTTETVPEPQPEATAAPAPEPAPVQPAPAEPATPVEPVPDPPPAADGTGAAGAPPPG